MLDSATRTADSAPSTQEANSKNSLQDKLTKNSLKNAIFNSKISAYYGLCIAIYPVFEVLFSIWRKKFWRKMSAMKPDAVHFHMLIFKRITKINYKTSIFIWLFNAPFIVLGSVFYSNTTALIALICAFICSYVYLYFKIIRFK